MTFPPCGKCGGRVIYDAEDRRLTCFNCAFTIAYIEDDGLVPCPVPPQKLITKSIKHGTLTAYNHYKCRCDLCRENWNAYNRAKGRARRSIPHGTQSGYGYHGCRCFECRKANADTKNYYRCNRDKTRTFVHGTTNGYEYHQCRCDACKAASSARKRKSAARAKAG